MASDNIGQLWFAKGNQLGIIRGGKFQIQLTLSRSISCIGRKLDGGIWICARRQLLQFNEGGQPGVFAQFPTNVERVQPQTILEDRSGAIWVGTSANGLFRFSGTNVEFVPTSYFDIVFLAQDREGNIWAGTSGGGLERVRPRIIELLGRESGLPDESLRSICEDTDGIIWAATWNGALARLENGTWTAFGRGTNMPGGVFSCVFPDPGGGVWIGTRNNGFYHLKDGIYEQWQQDDGLSSDNVRSIFQDSGGDVYIATDNPSRFQRLHDGQLEPLTMSVQLRSIRAVVEDVNKTIWVASADGSLMRVRNNELINETPGISTRLLSIRCLCTTPDGSLWIGYAGWGIGQKRKVHSNYNRPGFV